MNLPIRPEASNRKERLCWIRGITLNASTTPLHLLQGTGHLPAFLLFTRNKKPFMSPKINQPSAETPMKLALTREEAARALGISTAKNGDLLEILGLRKKPKVPAPSVIHDAVDKFENDQTLEALIGEIQRGMRENRHAESLDRLHTYCMKKFAHLLKKQKIACGKEIPLHSRVGMYMKALEKTVTLHETSKRIIRSSISVFDEFNHVRNNLSLAHDNQLLDQAEARFIFDSIVGILRFVKTLEEDNFGK
jgi:hypothetical protein